MHASSTFKLFSINTQIQICTLKYSWQQQEYMMVETSKFLLLNTVEYYEQVEILLKWMNELQLKNIISAYFI